MMYILLTFLSKTYFPGIGKVRCPSICIQPLSLCIQGYSIDTGPMWSVVVRVTLKNTKSNAVFCPTTDRPAPERLGHEKIVLE